MSIWPWKKPQTKSHVDAERVFTDIRSRFSPIPHVNPQNLSQWLDGFERGYLRSPALAFEAIENRDITIKIAAGKRKKDVARLDWEILTRDDSSEAAQQKEALEYFYSNLEARNAIDACERGGVELLVRQMMDSVGKKYAVHEIIWQPQAGGMMTAQLKFCPLWFFENIHGILRFLEHEFDVYGVDMEPDGWMVTVGEGIMRACSVAYMYSRITLHDWLNYSGKFGMPGIHGKTSSAKGSPEWQAMYDAVNAYAQNFAIVTNESEQIGLIECNGGGELPYPPLYEAMNRAMATLWRGGDLSTMSKGQQAVGSNSQQDDCDMLQKDDAIMISGTCQAQLDKPLLKYLFGPDIEALAYFKLKVPDAPATAAEVAVDQFLLSCGAKIGLQDTMERYGHPVPDEGDELLTAPKAVTSEQVTSDKPGNADASDLETLSNSAPDLATSHSPLATDLAVYRAIASDMQPVADRLAKIMTISDLAVRNQKLLALQADLAQLLRDINADPASAPAIAHQTAQAFASGYKGKIPAL